MSLWRVQDPTNHPSTREPHPHLTELAERIFVHTFAKQDSLICDPDELAEKAWQLAEAFQRAYSKRIK